MKIVCKKHWSIFVTRGFFAFIFLLLAISSIGNGDAPFAFVVIAAIIMAPAIILYKTEYIAIDGSMLIGHKGLIRSVKLSSPLSKVQGVSIGNGLVGKIFGYHTITIATSATGEIEYVFKQMADAQAFIAAVNEKIS